jgi:hypothetical protein
MIYKMKTSCFRNGRILLQFEVVVSNLYIRLEFLVHRNVLSRPSYHTIAFEPHSLLCLHLIDVDGASCKESMCRPRRPCNSELSRVK